MKVHKIICPKCQASMTSKAGIEEKTVIPCPRCKTKFPATPPADDKDDEIYEDFEVVDDDEAEEVPKKPAAKPALKPLSKQRKVEADDEDDEEEAPKKPAAKPALKPLSKQRKVEADKDEDDEEEEAPKKAAPKPALKPLSKKRKDDDEEDDDRPKSASAALSALGRHDKDDDRPASKKKSRDDDDEDDSPRSRRRGRDEEDEDEDDNRSRRRRRDEDDDEDDDRPKSGYAKLKSNVYVRAGVLGALLIIMGVLGYILYDKRKNKSDDTTEKKDDGKALFPNQAGQPIDPKDPKSKGPGTRIDDPELPRFQGTWRATRAVAGGQPAPAEELPKIAFVIRGSQVIPETDPTDVMTMRLNSTASPKLIDLVDRQNKTTTGIYRIVDAETVEISMNVTDNAPRPTGFTSSKGTTFMVLYLKRDAKKVEADPNPGKKAFGALEPRLVGKWSLPVPRPELSIDVEYRIDGTFTETITKTKQTSMKSGTWSTDGRNPAALTRQPAMQVAETFVVVISDNDPNAILHEQFLNDKSERFTLTRKKP